MPARRPRSGETASPASDSGDPSAVAPPVPIPNTEVKRCSPDGSTATGRARVGRRQNKNPGEFSSGFFLFNDAYSSREHDVLGSRRVDGQIREVADKHVGTCEPVERRQNTNSCAKLPEVFAARNSR